MGVKTKEFGRFLWILMEGVGRFYDDYQAGPCSKFHKKQMYDRVCEFFFLIGFIIPCIYCRLSYQGFTNPEKPKADIKRMLLRSGGGKRLVYELHNCVNNKLFNQELSECKTVKQVDVVREKWRKHSMTFEEALKQKFPSVDSHRFWNATIVSLALIMCDFRAEDNCHIKRFFEIIGIILLEIELGKVYMAGFRKAECVWSTTMDFPTRIDIVWTIKKYVFNVKGWSFSRTKKSLRDRCRETVVGCVK